MSNSSAYTRPADRWSPLYFLSSVGAGGLVVTFFMWLYMWVPHKGQPVPVFEDIAAAFANGAMLQQAAIVMAVLGIAGFAILNLKSLIWNMGQLARFKRTDAYGAMLGTNAESQLTALPLAIAMSINVGFILGLVFVPNLWGIVEYLFPLAMIGFALTALLAFAQTGRFIGQVIAKGGFNFAANNSFAQVLPAFAIAMIGVGLSAPAAMSQVAVVSGIAVIASTLLLVISLLWAAVAVVLGLAAMLQNGANAESAPTLLILVPLTTVLGILVLRQDHGLHVHFDAHAASGDVMRQLTVYLSIQIAFGLFGLAVLRAQGYFARFLAGRETSVGSYALVCPGVAISVLMQFWINKGLVGAGLIAKFGAAYWVLSAVAVGFQLAMIVLVLVLNKRHFSANTQAAIPAE
ncbi:TsoY family (seleno)protein [Pseudorhodobacter ferrugineus]|uniref:TsoY family (seleno)protein n=1 Tax=Pseudorhodobacter ferrugineus TaxID=77008 RepID=UPI00048AFD90|nr:hypothetical protein [Pseudorhodobacter ferrugineus]